MPTVTPTFPQYTNLPLGDGLFDQLMATVKLHIDKEWDVQRIRGDNYAKVYLGSMEAVMANTTQYLISVLLIDERKAKIIAETDLINVETDKALFELNTLMPLQADKITAEINLIDAQKLKVDQEVLFLQQKIITEVANIDGTVFDAESIIGRQTSLLLAQKYGFAGDIQHKAAKLQSDYDVVVMSVLEPPEQISLQNATLAAIALASTTAIDIKGA